MTFTGVGVSTHRRAVLRIRDVYPGSRISHPGSWILIFTHPGSRIPDLGSRILDPKTASKKMGKKICCHTLYCSHKFHKIRNEFIFKMLKKKIGPIYKELKNFLPKKLSLRSVKFGFFDLGSGIRKKTIPDPRSRGQKGTGSRIRIRNTTEEDDICEGIHPQKLRA
jgi:hypothetical protein